MTTLFKAAFIAAALGVLGSGRATAGILDRPEPGEVQKESAVKRTLEITRATGQSAMRALAGPAKLSRWIDRQRGRQLWIGVTINR
jgi:hypothetical protein